MKKLLAARIVRNSEQRRFAIASGVMILVAALLSSQPVPREKVGPLPDGGFLLNSGWRVKPAGNQIPLGTMPMSSVLSPDGHFLIVLNGGYRQPTLSVLDTKDGHEVGRTLLEDAWLGMALSANGKTLWVSGGSKASIYEFSLDAAGKLQPTRTFELVPQAGRTWEDFIGDVAAGPDDHLLYVCNLYRDSILVVNTQTGRVIDNFKTGRRPYRILFHPNGKSFYVSSWADGTVHRHQTDNGSQMQVIRAGSHPTDMVWRDRQSTAEDGDDAGWKARIFVAAANTNNVYVMALSDSGEMRMAESISVSSSPNHPLGMTPSALALSSDKKLLYVVCSGANAAAVVDVSEAHSHVLGFIPTGWYPTGAKALADGRLVVLNGRGSRSFPNPGGPNPTKLAAPAYQGDATVEYVGRIQIGSASVIAPLAEGQIQSYTAEVLRNSPYNDQKMEVIPEGVPEGIQHVIYIVKENRTYDQILGDIGKGESDPSLCLFPEKISPNHHKLAREFVLYDNFYVNGDVSADGHAWSTSAIANDYVEKLWPNSYGRRRIHTDYEGIDPASQPPAGYIWTNAAAKGISMRNYGYWVNNSKTPGADGIVVDSVRDPALRSITNMKYRSFDLDYPDVKRAQVFLDDVKEFEASGNMPQFIFMRLGNDHTSGTAAGKIAPLSSFADNDYALGMVVEAVSHSKFWASTAIFVLEDDAQNGPDHVDAHRSVAYIISPFTHTGTIDSEMYNTTSMLRTMELILKLRPMTHFDAGARPMLRSFSRQAVMAPYVVEKPRIALGERNPQGSPTAERSAKLDFEEADLNDDDELNDILWKALRGTTPPPPVRSFFGR